MLRSYKPCMTGIPRKRSPNIRDWTVHGWSVNLRMRNSPAWQRIHKIRRNRCCWAQDTEDLLPSVTVNSVLRQFLTNGPSFLYFSGDILGLAVVCTFRWWIMAQDMDTRWQRNIFLYKLVLVFFIKPWVQAWGAINRAWQEFHRLSFKSCNVEFYLEYKT